VKRLCFRLLSVVQRRVTPNALSHHWQQVAANDFTRRCARQCLTLSQKTKQQLLTRQMVANNLCFVNGSEIKSISSSPASLVGYSGHVVIDEFALHRQQEELLTTAEPIITWNSYRLEIISTPRNKNSHYFEMCCEPERYGYSFHKVTLTDALNQGLLQKLKQTWSTDDERQTLNNAGYFDYIRNQCVSPIAFQREYMCEFADEQ